MVRSGVRFKSAICKKARRGRNKTCGGGGGDNYEKMMKTLLLQNQQIIIQQQNMMFMVIKQLQPASNTQASQQLENHRLDQAATGTNIISLSTAAPTTSSSITATTNSAALATTSNQANANQPQFHQQLHQQLQQHHIHQQQHQEQQHHQQHQPNQQHHQISLHDEVSLQSHHLFNQATSATNSSNLDSQAQQQQLQENLCNYLTPAASEQDPIKPEEDDLAALLGGDGLLHNNLLYNPQTDIGSVTPYKNQQHQQQTPSYYSSGCESLTTPRVEQPRQLTTSNISQNVVKNLADSFKSPTKPKINVQILANSTTGSMKNSKAKIIQRMNISEFLRHVHPQTEETQQQKSIS